MGDWTGTLGVEGKGLDTDDAKSLADSINSPLVIVSRGGAK